MVLLLIKVIESQWRLLFLFFFLSSLLYYLRYFFFSFRDRLRFFYLWWSFRLLFFCFFIFFLFILPDDEERELTLLESALESEELDEDDELDYEEDSLRLLFNLLCDFSYYNFGYFVIFKVFITC